MPKWPYTHEDPIRAVHDAIDPECIYDDTRRCPDYERIKQAVTHYGAWAMAQPGTGRHRKESS